jgi:ADP-ribose pyrophosphatase
MDGQRLATERVYRGKILQVDRDRVRLPNGRETTLEMVRHPGAAAVVPLESDGRVVLIRQYRWAAAGTILEVPAGKLDPGEDPADCARREVEEETARRPGRLDRLGTIFTTPGFTDEVIHLYLARDLQTGRQRLDHDELIEVVPVPFDEVTGMTLRGEIRDAKSLCALLLAREFLAAESPSRS